MTVLRLPESVQIGSMRPLSRGKKPHDGNSVCLQAQNHFIRISDFVGKNHDQKTDPPLPAEVGVLRQDRFGILPGSISRIDFSC